MRREARKICKSQWMFWLIVILVFLNTCVLATEHHDQPLWLDDFQEYTNLFFVCLFTCEMLLKMYALGFSGYMVSLFNRCLSRWFLQVLIPSDDLQVRLCGGGELDHGVRAGQPGVDASSRSLSAPLHQTSQSFQSNQVSSRQWSSAPP